MANQIAGKNITSDKRNEIRHNTSLQANILERKNKIVFANKTTGKNYKITDFFSSEEES